MAKKRSNFISLYPLSPDEALRAALQTPPKKRQIVRAMLETPQDKVEIFNRGAEGEAKPKPKGRRGGMQRT